MRTLSVTLVVAIVASCGASHDPGEGGFISGLSGISEGSYDKRIDTRQQAVEAGRSKQTTLERQQSDLAVKSAAVEDEILALAEEHRKLRRQIGALERRIAVRRINLDTHTASRIEVSTRETASSDGGDQERLDSLRKAIKDARALVEDLTQILG